ncbi:hypothetical protein L1049_001674 [Liquidambar formosana]|uniref:Uncharacterized protein n=1 Tax=Liquidambar formosana TaxID=63359 RepID=A0AAP0R3Z4_LIQFO
MISMKKALWEDYDSEEEDIWAQMKKDSMNLTHSERHFKPNYLEGNHPGRELNQEEAGVYAWNGAWQEGEVIAEFPDFRMQTDQRRLGYTEEDDKCIPKNARTLNGNFVKEGENFPYCCFPEPWMDKESGEMKPGLEVFFGEKMNLEDTSKGAAEEANRGFLRLGKKYGSDKLEGLIII